MTVTRQSWRSGQVASDDRRPNRKHHHSVVNVVCIIGALLSSLIPLSDAQPCPGGSVNLAAGTTTYSGTCNVAAVISITASGTTLSLSGTSHTYNSVQISNGLSAITIVMSALVTFSNPSGGIIAAGLTSSTISMGSSSTLSNTGGSCIVFNGALNTMTLATTSATIRCAMHSVFFASSSSSTSSTLSGTGTTFQAGGAGYSNIYYAGVASTSTTVSYTSSTFNAISGTLASNINFTPLSLVGNSIVGITLSSCTLSTASIGIYLQRIVTFSIIGTATTIVSALSNVYLSNSNGTLGANSLVSFTSSSALSMTAAGTAATVHGNLKLDSNNLVTVSYTGSSLSATAGGTLGGVANLVVGGVTSAVGVNFLTVAAVLTGSVSGTNTGKVMSIGYTLTQGTGYPFDYSTGISLTASGVTFSAASALCFVCMEGYIIGAGFSFSGVTFTSAGLTASYYVYTENMIATVATSITSTSFTFASPTWVGATNHAMRFDNIAPVGSSPVIYYIDSLAMTFTGASTISFGKGFVSTGNPLNKLEISATGANFVSTASTAALSYVFAEVNTAHYAFDTVNFTLFLPQSTFDNVRIFTSFYRMDGGIQLFHTVNAMTILGVSTPQPTVAISPAIGALFNYYQTKSNTRTTISFTGALVFTQASLLQFVQCSASQVSYLGGALQLSSASMVTFTGTSGTQTSDLVLLFTPTSITITTSGSLFMVASGITVASTQSSSSFQITMTAIAAVPVSSQMLFQVAGVTSGVNFFLTNFYYIFSSNAVSMATNSQTVSFTLVSSPITCTSTAITFQGSAATSLNSLTLNWISTNSLISVASSAGNLAILDCSSSGTILSSVFQMTNAGVTFTGGATNDVFRAAGPVSTFAINLRQSGLISVSGQIFVASSTVISVTAEFNEVSFQTTTAVNNPFAFASSLSNSYFYFDRSGISTVAPSAFSMNTATTVTIRFEGQSAQILTMVSATNGVYITGVGSSLTITMGYVSITSTTYNVYYGGTSCTTCMLSMFGRAFLRASRNIYTVGYFGGYMQLFGEATLSSTGAISLASVAIDGNVVVTTANANDFVFGSGTGTFTVDTNILGNVWLDGDLNTASSIIQIVGTTMYSQRDNLKVNGRQFDTLISSATLSVTSTITGTNWRNFFVYSSFLPITSAYLYGSISITSSSFTRPATGSALATASANIYVDNGIDYVSGADTFTIMSSTFIGGNYAVHAQQRFNIPTTFTSLYVDTLISATSTGFAFSRMGVLLVTACGTSTSLASGDFSLSGITHIGRIINTVSYVIPTATVLKQNFVYFESSFVQHSISITASTYDRASNYFNMQYRFLELANTVSSTTALALKSITITNVNAVFKQYAYINAISSTNTVNVGSNMYLYKVFLSCFTIRTLDNIFYLQPSSPATSILDGTTITMSGIYAPIGNFAIYVNGIVANALGQAPTILFDNNILEVNKMVQFTGTSGNVLSVIAGCGKFGKGNIVSAAFSATTPALLSTNLGSTFCSPGVASCFDTLSNSRTGTYTYSESMSLSSSASQSSSEEQSESRSQSASSSMSLSQSQTQSQSATPTISSSMSQTNTEELSESKSQTSTGTMSLSNSEERSESKTVSISSSDSGTSSSSPSEELTSSDSTSASASTSSTWSLSTSQSLSYSMSMSQTLTETMTISQTEERSQSESITLSNEASLTMSESASRTPSQSFSEELSLTKSPSFSLSPTYTISDTPTEELTETITDTLSPSASMSLTYSLSESYSPSVTSSFSSEISESRSMTISISDTQTLTLTQEQSRTPTSSATMSFSEELTQTFKSQSTTYSDTGTPSLSPSFEASESKSASQTLSKETPSLTYDDTFTVTVTQTFTDSMSRSMTSEATGSRSLSRSSSGTSSLTDDRTPTMQSQTPTSTVTATMSLTPERTRTPTVTGELTMSESTSPSQEQSISDGSVSMSTTNSSSRGTASATSSVSSSPTLSYEIGSFTTTDTITKDYSGTLTSTQTASLSVTPSSTRGTLTRSESYSGPSVTEEQSHSVTGSREVTATSTKGKSKTRRQSLTSSATPDESYTATPSQSMSTSFTKERTRSFTRSESYSADPPSSSRTGSVSTESTKSLSATTSQSRTASHSRSQSAEVSVSWNSRSFSDSVTQSPSTTDSKEVSASFTPSITASPSVSRSEGTTTPDLSMSTTPSFSKPTMTRDASSSFTISMSPTTSATKDLTLSVGSHTFTVTNEHTKSRSHSATDDDSGTITISRSRRSATLSHTKSRSFGSRTRTLTWYQEPAGLTGTPTLSDSQTLSTSPSLSRDATKSFGSLSETLTMTESQTKSLTKSWETGTIDESRSFTVTSTTTATYRTITQTRTRHSPTNPSGTVDSSRSSSVSQAANSRSQSTSNFTENKTASLLATHTHTWKETFSGTSDVTVTSTVTITPPPTPTPTYSQSLQDRPPGNLLGFFASVLNDSRCDSNNTYYAINGPLIVVILLLLLCRLVRCNFPCVTVETYRNVPQWRSLIVQHSYAALVVPCHFQCFFAHYLLFFVHANILLILVATFALIFPASNYLQAAYSCAFATLVAQIVRPLFNGLFYRNSIRRLRLQKRIRDPEEAFVSMEADEEAARRAAGSPGSIASGGADSDWATIEEDENLSSQYNETEEEDVSEVFEEVPSETTEEGPLPDAPERDPTDEVFNASFSFDEDDYHFTKGKSFKMIMTHGKDEPVTAASSTSRKQRRKSGAAEEENMGGWGGVDEDGGGPVVIDIDSDFIAGAFDFDDDNDGKKKPLDANNNGWASTSMKSLKRPTSSGGGGAGDVKSLWSMDMGSKTSGGGPLPPPPRELFWDPRRAASEQSYQQYEFDDVAKYSPAGTASVGGASSAYGGMAMVRRGTWVADSQPNNAANFDDAPDDALVNLSLSSMSIGSVLSDLSSSYESGADEFEQALRIKYSVRTHYLLASVVTALAGAGAVVLSYYLRHRLDDEVPTCGHYDTAVPMVFVFDFVLGQSIFVALVYLGRYLQHDESLRYSRKFSELHPINDEVRIMSVERGRFYIRKLKESHKYKKELERMRREGIVDRVDKLLEDKHNHRAPPDHVTAFVDDGEVTQQRIGGGGANTSRASNNASPNPRAPGTGKTPLKNNASSSAASPSSPKQNKANNKYKPSRDMSSSTSTNSSGSDFDPDAANATKWNPDEEDDFNFLASTQRFSTALER
ncbi:membrane-associated protein, putative [Bodo saltans]|uniref:Membrane-associated protein, putative n=1 Tax=Bodo saltans TaxID=75058 RepID=A0A0S4J1D7_BODSA|nr:membrane-associated protein, putative [Bodo saltans]|eukprot:CUG79844.1 membrane-associated protein, putative [Bodo saltans]